MGNLTVGKLRELLEGVPDDTPIIGDECDHMYRQLWYSGTGYSTVLKDADGQYTDDIFVPANGEGIGEVTEYGVRMKAFIIQ